MSLEVVLESMAPSLLPIVIACAVAGLAYSLLSLFAQRDARVDTRLSELESDRGVSNEHSSWRRRLAARLQGVIPGSVVRLATNASDERGDIKRRLQQAGCSGNEYVSMFAAARCCLAVLPVLMSLLAFTYGYCQFREALLWAVGGCALGVLLPGMWLNRRVRRRQSRLLKAIPDLFDLLVTCLSSGLTIEASLKRVNEELRLPHPELASELARVQNEVDLGVPVVDALKHFAERCNLKPIRSLALIFQQTRQFGTKSVEALRAHANLMRSQREHEAEERARKAAVQILAPTVLLIFPSVLVVVAGPAAFQVAEAMQPASQHAEAEPQAGSSQ